MENTNNDILITTIDTIAERINEDKQVLVNIINAINRGVTSNGINDKLIDKLTALTYTDSNVTFASEYISLILTNLQSQHIRNNKEYTEELVKILTHNLDLLKALEQSITVFNTSIHQHVNNHVAESHYATDPVKNKKSSTTIDKIIDKIPTSGISSVLFWGAILSLVITISVLVDRHIITDTTDLVNAVKTKHTGLPNANR